MNIGTFKQTDKGYEGTIVTLGMNHKAKFVANDNKKSDDSPDYFVKAGTCDLGVGWNAIAKDDGDGENAKEPLEYIKVKLDSPVLPSPIWAALFKNGKSSELVWNRARTRAEG